MLLITVVIIAYLFVQLRVLQGRVAELELTSTTAEDISMLLGGKSCGNEVPLSAKNVRFSLDPEGESEGSDAEESDASEAEAPPESSMSVFGNMAALFLARKTASSEEAAEAPGRVIVATTIRAGAIGGAPDAHSNRIEDLGEDE